MCFIPVAAYPYIDFERHIQIGGVRHMCKQLSYKGLHGAVGGLQDQFVMDLHDEPGRRVGTLEP